MKTIRNTMVIDKPNKEAIAFIQMVQKRKDEVKNSIQSRKSLYFPKK